MAPCNDAHAAEHAVPNEQGPWEEPQLHPTQPSPQAAPQRGTPADLAHTNCRAASGKGAEALELC